MSKMSIYSNASELTDALVRYNNYAYATGYLTSVITSLGWELNLTQRQVERLALLLDKRTAEVIKQNQEVSTG